MPSEMFRVLPSLPSNLQDQLDEAQMALLLEIATPYAQGGAWPVWHYVVGQMDKRGLDAQEVIASLPRVGSSGTLGPSYGFTAGHDWRMIRDNDKVALTVAAALPLEGLRGMLANPFLRTLGHMIKLQREAVPSPTEVTQTWLESKDLLRAIPGMDPRFVAVLPEILGIEPATRGGSSSGPNPGDPSWRKEITREVLRYADALNLTAYVAKVGELTVQQVVNAQRAYPGADLSGAYGQQFALTPAVEEQTAVEQAEEPEPYVDIRHIKDWEQAAAAAKWDVSRLSALANDLNACYAQERPLSCLMQIRAIMDHIPPLFGHHLFSQVASQFPGIRTDKAYVKALSDNRLLGDDVLHRHIGEQLPRITMHEVPARIFLDALLRGVVTVLRTAAEEQVEV
ncbi:hypothetical protein [Streptomyces sp. NBC_01198]|uniref:hypothetical protein n=1 Tax=Streptomyces sp. NBC_01198 TaxID=2903769 RepID=UPI002E11A142|nr:hypothetical protein OG702_35120 [Streptomyces sp. NBC_01198]